jgi:transcription-repair coupling factor (superfamily II helicase)
MERLADAIRRAEGTVSLSGLEEGAPAFLLAALKRSLSRPIVVVTPDRKRAQVLTDALRFFVGAHEAALDPVVHLPAPDTLPFHPTAPNRFLVMQRVAGLFRLAHGLSVDFVVIPAETLCRRTIPTHVVNNLADIVLAGDSLDRHGFVSHLDEAGYTRVPMVEDPGTYAVRGGIIDVYSPVERTPVRIDLFGDEVESLRRMDPETQRGGESLEELTVCPVHEVVLTEETLRRSRGALRHQGGELGMPAPQLRAILGELEAGVRPLGVEGWLPAFYDEPSMVADFIPDNALWVVEEPGKVRAVQEALFEQVADGYEQALQNHQLVYPTERLFVQPERKPDVQLLTVAYEQDLADTTQVALSFDNHQILRTALAQKRGQDRALVPLVTQVQAWRQEGHTVIAVASGAGHAERLRSVLANYELSVESMEGAFPLASLSVEPAADVLILRGNLPRGFGFPAMGLVVLGDQEILPSRTAAARGGQGKKVLADALASFRDLASGDFVVHVDHGIGRYEGLVSLAVGEVENDYLKLTYRDASRAGASQQNVLYLPVQRLDRVQKYVAADGATPSLDRLGTPGWEKTKARVRRAAEDIARELLAIQAARAARQGHAFGGGGDYFAQFETDFPYEETPDQATAIEDVMSDMGEEQPMDRLVCGDVGYGKTEVAMRAAFRAVLDGKQVVILVPTTVLCEQHRLTFKDRFHGYPVRIEALSRFRSVAERAQIIEDLKTGKVDVVIGTHRVLSSDVSFRDLGLLVIDEEHRFGVKHKERIKQMRETVDVLTMTATPIPRTLNMALSGLREMSIIATPPTDRLAVRTLVSQECEPVIAEAIDRELRRSGQVYFVHNRVGTIQREAERVRRLVPGARVRVGHGQMAESELEKVMLAFMAGECDVLVCTTIIESGLDIPRANTMLINRADTFGLAQLYQLRGRIGRSSERAYCYLMVPEPRNLSGIAEKRVATIQRFTELGSGFHIATMDMEMRGVGNLLGAQQSGHVKDVGLELFSELLTDAVRALKQEDEVEDVRVSCETKVGINAFLPASYVPDVSVRLQFYKCFATAQDHAELGDVFSDLVDQCGRPPEEAQNLLAATHLKIDCQRLGAQSVAYNRGGLVVHLSPQSKLAGEAVVGLIQRPGSRWKLTPQIELVRGVTETEWSGGIESARKAIRELLRYGEEKGLLLQS